MLRSFFTLGRAQVSGTIPSTFSALQSMVYMDLGRNLLTGTIPMSLTEMTSLTYVLVPVRSQWDSKLDQLCLPSVLMPSSCRQTGVAK
jgi:hypothetical protein